MSLTSLSSTVALSYARKGWKVFPLPSGSKKPTLLNSWKNEATTNEEQIKSWGKQWPDANIGIVTGYESGIVVLDIDVKENVNGFKTLKELEQKHGKLPPTLTVKTPSGGEHRFFKHPGGKIKTKAGVFEGLDSKGDGGLVVGAGSVGDNGKLYEVINDDEPAEMPNFWFEAVYEGRLWDECLQRDPIGEGKRNEELFRIGCSIRAKGAHEKDVEITLKEVNKKRCIPPVRNKELWSIIKQVLKYEKGECEEEELEEPYTFANQQNLIEQLRKYGKQDSISTGFYTLDNALGGGLFPGMYALGAITSLGKTTLALQMADSIASSGHDVLFYSLEMSNIEMLARSISRNTGDKTVRDVLSGRVQEDTLKEACKNYPWHNIEIIEGNFKTGVQEIRKRVQRHCKEMNRKPVVFVDYLQIIQPQDVRMSDKQAVDRNVVDLKRISRDFDIPLILVSSFNRDNYNTPVSFSALKETGSIEYACDVILGLQLVVVNELEGTAQEKQKLINEAKKENPRRVELVILKNRSGIPWATIPFKYYPAVNRFDELGVVPKKEVIETISTSDYIYVSDGKSFHPYAQELINSSIIAIDTETTGLDPFTDRIRLIQFKIPNKPAVLVDMFKLDASGKELVKDLLIAGQTQIYHNAKFDLKMLIASDLYITDTSQPQEIFDTMIADQIITAGIKKKGFSLADVVRSYLNKDLPKEQQKSNWSQDYLSEAQLQYASRDVDVLIELYEVLKRRLEQEELMDVAQLEFYCVKAVAKMELNGMLVSNEKLAVLEQELLSEKDSLSQKLKEIFGDINFNSTKQLQQALEEQGIKVTSTSRSTLSQIKNENVSTLLEYKKTEKLNQFTKKLSQHTNPITGRIHASYNQLGAETGRFTCSNPNLQQIPREESFRSCFIANPNEVLVIADYSQIELRAIAEIAGEKAMIQAFLEDQDLHTLTASIILEKAIDDVTKEDRQSAKAVNFSLIYGAGATTLQKIARDNYGVTMSMDESEKYRNRFFEAYKGIRDWHNLVKSQSQQEIRTISGRRRLLEPNARVTTMFNTPIQGLCACILKKALCNLDLQIDLGEPLQILSVVHDEIIVSTSIQNAYKAKEILKKEMIEAGKAYLKKVPVEVDAIVSPCWAKG